ncbi:hypothetical protein M5689_003814 [Euphorbia peplus]|nr:hypothetical protein M5689_003814 [Euphorbia peplus]
MKDGVKYILTPMMGERNTKEKSTLIVCPTQKAFIEECKDSQLVYILMVKASSGKEEERDVPIEVSSLIKEYQDLFSKELPHGL